jgi:hypothetical protein
MIFQSTIGNFFLLSATLLILFLFTGCNSEKVVFPEEIEAKLPEKVDFNYHIKPILSDRCFACHGPDENKIEAGLRLDIEEVAFSALESGEHALVSGNLAKSQVYHRITSTDADYQMPPPESNLMLTEYEKALLIRWIEQGAEYKPHWSFIPPEKPEVPEVAQTEWVKNPIDNFILTKLEKQGLQPAKEADKETLIRRASFTITGLPPAIEEVDAFLADEAPDAYGKAVDHMLASSAYGERMAAHWMDVARYADSHGYLDDKHRPMWPWRDWVIQSFNRNQPYNDFITWQIAGDLLPNASRDQILATAFNRNHMQNSEAGIIYEEYRVEYVVDRTNTFGKAFMGLTMECARCHDHKYDPISQKDYYQLFGFFNSTFEIGSPSYGVDQTPGPALMLPEEDMEKKIAYIQEKLEKKEKELATYKEDVKAKYQDQFDAEKAFKEVDRNVNKDLVAYYPFDKIVNEKSENKVNPAQPAHFSEPVPVEGVKNGGIKINANNNVILEKGVGEFERTDPFTISFWMKPAKKYEEATVFFHADHKRYGFKGYALLLKQNRLSFQIAHSWPHNAIHITAKDSLPAGKWAYVTLTYDGSSKADGMHIYVDGQRMESDIEYDHLYKSIIPEPDIHITAKFQGFRMGIFTNHTTFPDGLIDELKLFKRDLTGVEVAHLHENESPENITGPQKDKDLFPYYLANYDKNYKQELATLKELREEENELLSSVPEIMVMGDLPEPRPTFVLERGVYDAPGEQVQPDAPEWLLTFSEDLPKNRLGLAQWLTNPKNPLTARVAVNRIWQLHFGKGLVKSSDDFGNQGDLPTHPELLDWLAVEFIESGWDVKALHKLIVTSATYRQHSAITPEILERDPENLLLARGPRYRLSAEMIRDNALATSGLLVDKTGGPSVYPYQPEGLWDEITNKVWRYKYDQSEGEGLYRRSLYTIWKRTSPPPAMLIFDAADRGSCTVKRQTTSTPLQALVLLNDPQYLEAARVLAGRMIKEGGDTPEKQLVYGFRVLTGREPGKEELSLITHLYQEELENYTEYPAKARAYLSIGEHTTQLQVAPAQLAALAVTAHAVMNTDEAYTLK